MSSLKKKSFFNNDNGCFFIERNFLNKNDNETRQNIFLLYYNETMLQFQLCLYIVRL